MATAADGDVTLAIGLMSGTSMDGVDAALLATDGATNIERFPGAEVFVPYSAAERAILAAALDTAAAREDRLSADGYTVGDPAFSAAEAILHEKHCAAVRELLRCANRSAAQISVIGFHGQTVLHRPERGLTVQIGDPAALAAAVGIACMANLRHNDMRHGGQGAPLVPAYHAALAAQLPEDEPVAVVNVGGVANVTWLPAGDLVTKLAGMRAFDVGPGNALIDEFVCAHTSALFDQDGAIAAQGSVDHSALEACLQHPFFLAPAPKSLDRRDFHRLPAVQMLLRSGDLHTGAATLTALTAHAIALSELHTPGGPGATALWIITGGGARNATLLRQLSALLNAGTTARERTVQTADALGWSSAHLEAEAFAYLAVRARQQLPLTWPGSTGVTAPVTGGQIFPLS